MSVGALPSLRVSTLGGGSKREAKQAGRQRSYYCRQSLNEAVWFMPICELFLNLAFHIFNFILIRISHQGPISILFYPDILA